ncbi:acyltransferase family protein [Micromonospora sp. ATA51]|uniref:acyltransferase family protein n=1 Tax=Micromonospora sp. ATA51 TaxID=2806098 RepID=UPI001A4E5F99|nr:acyltransferase family protein [Micromonospora sp. ATA51]MBM0225020.1 acyltransferase family protein [Micromonospora sp. ATA51]
MRVSALLRQAIRADGGTISRPSRDAYFDNAKLLATALVVLGHTWGPLVGSPNEMRGVRALYLLVYAFHMPLFVMISGYFSRSFAQDASHPGRLRRLLTSTLVPYLIFATAYQLYNNYRLDESNPIDLVTPFYLTWFLVALFVWRISAPLWLNLRAPVAVATGVMLASGAASLSGELDLARILQFLPFFVLGLTARREHLEWIRDTRWLRPAAVLVFAAALITVYHYAPRLPAGWFYRHNGHAQLDVSWGTWAAGALGLTAAALVLSVAFLALVPSNRNLLTPLASGTQYTYLLHGFIVQIALAYRFQNSPFVNSFAGVLTISALAVLATGILASPIVRRLFGWAVEPQMSWAFAEVRAEKFADARRPVTAPGSTTAPSPASAATSTPAMGTAVATDSSR